MCKRNRHHLSLAAAVAAVAVLTATLGAPAYGAAPPHTDAAEVAAAVAVPRLDWKPCEDRFPGFLCANATVPVDYDDPGGRTTTIALAKRPASDPAHRIGTVFVNPGGPGSSGVFKVEFGLGDALDAELDGRFDVVGFDPRGVIASDPIHCFGSQEAEDHFVEGLPIFPYRPDQVKPFYDRWTSLASTCLAADPLTRHMSTADVARDLDLLRRAVGDSKLSYLGFSYGGYIGDTYANLFPDKVRAMVFDGVLDPRLWSSGWQVDSDRVSTEKVWNELLRLCDVAGDECAFHTPGGAKDRWERLADAIREQPVTLDDGFVYSYDFLIQDAFGTAARPEGWDEDLAFYDSVADLVEARTSVAAGTSGRRAAVVANQRPTKPEPTYFNFLEAAYGNMCADIDYPRTLGAFQAIGDYAERGSRFGPWWWWYNTPCAHWPVADDRYTGPWTARTSAPVLVVGNYFDPSTAYSGARATANQLPNSRLLSYAGWGHTAYLRSACVTDAVNAYLIRGTLPPQGTVCPANPNPFLPSPDPQPAPNHLLSQASRTR